MIRYSEKVKQEELVKALQRKLAIFGRFSDTEIIATSGLRSIEKNKQVGGIKTSSHLNGSAIDLSCPNSRIRHEILFCAIAVGFRRIGIGKDHIHLDLDVEKTQDLIFFDHYTPK